jgi:Zn finger protein HypA/HybF involved in hydrogenase expression
MAKRKYTIKQLSEAVSSSQSIRQVLVKLGLSPKGGSSCGHIKRLAHENNIDMSHMLGQAWMRGKCNPSVRKRAASEIFVKSSPYRGASVVLKQRFIEEFKVPYKCAICNLSEWTGRHIVLHIDHINGDNIDNRRENLRLLCPNCHSMTDTYCGRNSKIRAVKKAKENNIKREGINQISENICLICQLPTNNKKYCSSSCYHKSTERLKPNQRKVQRPSLEQLKSDLSHMSYLAVGRKYGVSDQSIRKWLRWETKYSKVESEVGE